MFRFSRGRFTQIAALAPAAGGGGAFTSATITVASGTVLSNLTDFVTRVDLSDMPSGFWTEADADGGNIRMYESDGTTQIPFDLVHIDIVNEVGNLFFKADLLTGSDNDFVLKCDGVSLLPATDTYGRNNTWSDFHRVGIFPDLADRTGVGSNFALGGSNIGPYEYEVYASSGDVNAHQGVCWDGTHYYTSDDNELKKWDASWSLVDTNSDPIGDSAIGGGANHCGDIDVHSGIIYVPIELYPSGPYANQHIAMFDASDLSFISSYDISAQAHEASAVAYNPDDNLLYVTDYTVSGGLHKYDPTDGSYIGAVTLSVTHIRQQGITFFGGKMFISVDPATGDAFVTRYTQAGVFEGRIFSSSGGVGEGLGHNDDGLLWLRDAAATETVYELRPATRSGQVGWLNLNNLGHAKATGLTRYTTWTMGASVVVNNKTANHAVLSYTEDATSNATRATLAFRDAPDGFGHWNTTDSWLMDATDPTAGVEYRVNATQATTANRKVYMNGTGTQDTTVAQKPSGAGAVVLYVGAEDLSLSELMVGSINYVYLRNGELTANWIAAEDISWRTPASFYTIV
jgi:hypothetical protein